MVDLECGYSPLRGAVVPENKSGFVPNKSRKKINPEIFWLLAIFLLAVALRTAAAFSRGMVQFDETSYARIAENLLLVQNPLDITGTSATWYSICLLYTSDAADDLLCVDLGGRR